jgi:hypothetical protein
VRREKPVVFVRIRTGVSSAAVALVSEALESIRMGIYQEFANKSMNVPKILTHVLRRKFVLMQKGALTVFALPIAQFFLTVNASATPSWRTTQHYSRSGEENKSQMLCRAS